MKSNKSNRPKSEYPASVSERRGLFRKGLFRDGLFGRRRSKPDRSACDTVYGGPEYFASVPSSAPQPPKQEQ